MKRTEEFDLHWILYSQKFRNKFSRNLKETQMIYFYPRVLGPRNYFLHQYPSITSCLLPPHLTRYEIQSGSLNLELNIFSEETSTLRREQYLQKESFLPILKKRWVSLEWKTRFQNIVTAQSYFIFLILAPFFFQGCIIKSLCDLPLVLSSDAIT